MYTNYKYPKTTKFLAWKVCRTTTRGEAKKAAETTALPVEDFELAEMPFLQAELHGGMQDA